MPQSSHSKAEIMVIPAHPGSINEGNRAAPYTLSPAVRLHILIIAMIFVTMITTEIACRKI